MKDIVLKSSGMKIQNVISWVGFIVFGAIISWIIAIALANYGKVTSNDVKSKKNVLNKTWQKFRFFYGAIVGDLYLIALLISLIL